MLGWVGEAASLGSAACFAVGLTLFTPAVRAVGAREVNLFKGAAALTLFLLLLGLLGMPAIPLGSAGILATSGVIGLAIGDTFILRALALLGPHRAALFGCLGPIFTATGDWLFRGHGLAPVEIAGILLAAGGVALVVSRPARKDAGSASALGALYGSLSAACNSLGVILSKAGLEQVPPLPATCIRLAASTLALAAIAALQGRLIPGLRPLLSRRWLPRVAVAAAIGTFGGLWLMLTGIRYTHAGVANALHTTTPLFTLPISVLWLGERPGGLAVVGSFVAVGGVAVLFLSG